MLSDYHRYRLYEILPGLTVWFTITAAIVLSFVRPLWMIYFIIVFDIYWVLKVVNFSFYLSVAWYRFKRTQRSDWKDRLRHEITNADDKIHVVFLTLYNEG